MNGLLDKLRVIARRDLLTAARYRSTFWMQAAGMFVEIAAFYYLARAVGPSFRPDGMDYFPFLLIGTGFYGFFVAGISSFVSAVHDAQASGTMEVLMTTSTPAPVIVTLTAASTFAQRTVQLALYLTFGLWIFRVPVTAPNILGCVAVFLLSLAIAIAIGIAAAALQITVQKGAAVVWLFASVAWLMTGMTFPISVLPAPLRTLAHFIPITHSLDGLRLALMTGASFTALAPTLAALLTFTLLLLPTSLLLFSLALRHARLEGTLSFY